MAKRYQHRIGVRAEICIDLILDVCDSLPEQISQAVAEALRQAADVDGGFRLEALPGGLSDHPKPANESDVWDIDTRGGL